MLLSSRLGKVRDLQATALNKPMLNLGSTGDGVAAVQDLLRDLGHAFPRSYRKGYADGIYGTETKANVEAYQRGAGLKGDGIVGRRTITALDELVIKNNILEDHTDAEFERREAKNRDFPMNRRTRVAT